MTTRRNYNKLVIGKNYVEGMVECGRKRVFGKRDSPKKWGMSCFAPRVAEGVYDDGADNKTSWWNIGFVSDEFGELHLFPSVVGKNFAYCINPTSYWFCRKRKWMPYWGRATKQRSKLVKEIRAFWANKWCVETLPAMKKALADTTSIPDDILEFVMPEYIEYPYEIKRF
jgi:hypothetical protein